MALHRTPEEAPTRSACAVSPGQRLDKVTGSLVPGLKGLLSF